MQLTDLPARVRNRLTRDEIIYLVAPSGNPNFGDELIAKTWLEYLARVRPHALVVLDCHSPGQASIMLRRSHPRAVFVDTLWRLTLFAAGTERPDIDRPDGLDPDRGWEWVARAASNLGVASHLDVGIDLLLRAASIHLLGGGYVNGIWPQHLSLATAIAAVGGRTGAPTYATGQGLTPTFDDERAAILTEALSRFHVVDVRDRASAEAFASIAPSHSGDDAWLSMPAKAPATADGDGVVLCLQSDLTADFTAHGKTGVEAVAALVTALLDEWDVAASQITVIECIPGIDYTVPHLMGDRLDGATFVPFLDVWRDGLPIGVGHTWISTRFHPHLLAAAAGDSGVAIAGHPDYYATKHQSLVDVGSRWSLVTGPGQSPSKPAAGGFAPAARRANVERKTELAQSLYPNRVTSRLRTPRLR
ncbi:polysaccharide pyruvyl transferase family protein [Gordonia sp. TBRC 11910]|uniref:Polysaccharide pyruvyl transferase family protein n=1 Tax=Gordonia asplenii TaxID=2725283 RepID=A0A848KPY7_9ACTN|nr:polysaccharide pyruvyl transferase family protein [Gordonia asplenii]NMO00302.1 polysaccharide pyruvyl transferase family protein [Gordonia asplenii]